MNKFITLDTIAVITVPESALEPLREDEVLCARVLADKLSPMSKTFGIFTGNFTANLW